MGLDAGERIQKDGRVARHDDLCSLGRFGRVLSDDRQHTRMQTGFRLIDGDQGRWFGAGQHRK
jgi:hypothetical protein